MQNEYKFKLRQEKRWNSEPQIWQAHQEKQSQNLIEWKKWSTENCASNDNLNYTAQWYIEKAEPVPVYEMFQIFWGNGFENIKYSTQTSRTLQVLTRNKYCQIVNFSLPTDEKLGLNEIKN